MASAGEAASIVSDWIGKHYSDRVFRATVTGTNGNQVYVRRASQGSADPVSYPRLDTYSPVAGDDVLCVTVSDVPLIVGKILR